MKKRKLLKSKLSFFFYLCNLDTDTKKSTIALKDGGFYSFEWLCFFENSPILGQFLAYSLVWYFLDSTSIQNDRKKKKAKDKRNSTATGHGCFCALYSNQLVLLCGASWQWTVGIYRCTRKSVWLFRVFNFAAFACRIQEVRRVLRSALR